LFQRAAFAVTPFINEIHYDPIGTDVGEEGIEIAGAAGTNLIGWSLILYNGATSSLYVTIILNGSLGDEGRWYGALWFDVTGLQNGSPDGIALVDHTNTVTQLLSYEGTFTAINGPAVGMTSIDIGVMEDGTTPRGVTPFSSAAGGLSMRNLPGHQQRRQRGRKTRTRS